MVVKGPLPIAGSLPNLCRNQGMDVPMMAELTIPKNIERETIAATFIFSQTAENAKIVYDNTAPMRIAALVS